MRMTSQYKHSPSASFHDHPSPNPPHVCAVLQQFQHSVSVSEEIECASFPFPIQQQLTTTHQPPKYAIKTWWLITINKAKQLGKN